MREALRLESPTAKAVIKEVIDGQECRISPSDDILTGQEYVILLTAGEGELRLSPHLRYVP